MFWGTRERFPKIPFSWNPSHNNELAGEEQREALQAEAREDTLGLCRADGSPGPKSARGRAGDGSGCVTSLLSRLSSFHGQVEKQQTAFYSTEGDKARSTLSSGRRAATLALSLTQLTETQRSQSPSLGSRRGLAGRRKTPPGFWAAAWGRDPPEQAAMSFLRTEHKDWCK